MCRLMQSAQELERQQGPLADLPHWLLQARIEEAVRLRKALGLPSAATNAFRLINRCLLCLLRQFSLFVEHQPGRTCAYASPACRPLCWTALCRSSAWPRHRCQPGVAPRSAASVSENARCDRTLHYLAGPAENLCAACSACSACSSYRQLHNLIAHPPCIPDRAPACTLRPAFQ